MKKSAFFLAILVLWSMPNTLIWGQWAVAVKTSGSFERIVQQSNFSTQINLDTLEKSHLFALGELPNMKGHLTIYEGRSLRTAVKDSYLRSDTSFGGEASLLVYSYVNRWKKIPVEASIRNLSDLEEIIAETAFEHGVSLMEPFPFMVQVWCKNVQYSVIDWENANQHSAENHRMYEHQLLDSNTGVMVMGFYSTKHQGIFTQKTNLYAHVIPLTSQPLLTGWLDNIETMGPVTVLLPMPKAAPKANN
jgi:acetolactate decarboxylase